MNNELLLPCVPNMVVPLSCTSQQATCLGHAVGAWRDYQFGKQGKGKNASGTKNYWCWLVPETLKIPKGKGFVTVPAGSIATLEKVRGEFYETFEDLFFMWFRSKVSFVFANDGHYAPRTQTTERGNGFAILEDMFNRGILDAPAMNDYPLLLFPTQLIKSETYTRNGKPWVKYASTLIKSSDPTVREADIFLTRSNPTVLVRRELSSLSNDLTKELAEKLGNSVRTINFGDLESANFRMMLAEVISYDLWQDLTRRGTIEGNRWLSFLKEVRVSSGRA